MKILITGGSGFLGRRAAAHFSSLGHQVLTPSHRQLDITQEEAVQTWFRENHPQAVLHCAAVSDTGICQRDPEGTARINVGGPVHLAAACADIGTKFVFCSSDQVYAASLLPGPHAEAEVLNPQTVYANQKLLAEQRCSQLCPDTVSLRLSWMYSSAPQPQEHGHLLTALLAALADDRLPLTWPIYDHRGITDVDAVVSQLPAVLNFPAGVYNFGAGNDNDTYHTIQAVFTELNLRNALDRLEPNLQAFADAPRDIRMDGTLAASLGVSFEDTQTGLCRALAKCL